MHALGHVVALPRQIQAAVQLFVIVAPIRQPAYLPIASLTVEQWGRYLTEIAGSNLYAGNKKGLLTFHKVRRPPKTSTV